MTNFISYKNWLNLNEEFIGYKRYHPDEKPFEILKNPFPNEIPNDIRAIGDYNGNIWVALSDYYDWATHSMIANIVKNFDEKIESPYKYENRSNTIALHRYKGYNVFGLGESYREIFINDIIKSKTWKKLIRKQVEWQFIGKRIGYVSDTDVRQRTFSFRRHTLNL
jgi:hypothetical protein